MSTDNIAPQTAVSKAGTFKLGQFAVNRLGYGAMQLAGRATFRLPVLYRHDDATHSGVATNVILGFTSSKASAPRPKAPLRRRDR